MAKANPPFKTTLGGTPWAMPVTRGRAGRWSAAWSPRAAVQRAEDTTGFTLDATEFASVACGIGHRASRRSVDEVRSVSHVCSSLGPWSVRQYARCAHVYYVVHLKMAPEPDRMASHASMLYTRFCCRASGSASMRHVCKSCVRQPTKVTSRASYSPCGRGVRARVSKIE